MHCVIIECRKIVLKEVVDTAVKIPINTDIFI